MTEYALSTNLYTFAQTGEGFFAWPHDAGEADVIRSLKPGDLIVPKFAQSPAWGPSGEEGMEALREYCKAIEVDFDKVLQDYQDLVQGGAHAVPFLLRVGGPSTDDTRYQGTPWSSVPVERTEFSHPLSTREFLLLRVLPIEIAAQFKGAVAPGRHLQELSPGTVKSVEEAASTPDREEYLRKYSVVEAPTPAAAAEILEKAGRSLSAGDRVFIASPGGLLGVHDVAADGNLASVGTPIPRTPEDLLDLFEQAKQRVQTQDQFTPSRAIAALHEIKELLDGPTQLVVIDDFGQFHDRYNLLATKVTQALEISKRPLTSSPPVPVESEEDEPGIEVDELAALSGLTVSSVRNELPDGFKISDEVLADLVTALRSGNHLLLSGPPGTGKTTVAEAVCRAVVGQNYEVATGTSDWTTFDTIGGYMPSDDGLVFEPGIVLKCLQRGRWLVIDELNRADIDKAFGPLFTVLSGSGANQSGRRVVLPFQQSGHNIEIRTAEKRVGANGNYIITPGWRLIGTLNVSDKATLFQLSFAFLRRFAVVDIPLPDRADYESFFGSLCTDVPEPSRTKIVGAAIEIAFGARQLGPAILKDVGVFLGKGLAETASGAPAFADEVEAFVAALRLYGVPQYEGAASTDTASLVGILKSVWPERSEDSWQPLKDALLAVALS